MAAGSVIFYQHALEDAWKGLLDLASMTLNVTLVSHGYTPNFKSHSVWTAGADAAMPETYVVTAAGFAERTLVSSTVARTSGSYVTWDANDITLSATATIKAKWAIIYKGSGNKRLIACFDTETTQTTGVEVTQLVVQWNALGVAQLNNPSA